MLHKLNVDNYIKNDNKVDVKMSSPVKQKKSKIFKISKKDFTSEVSEAPFKTINKLTPDELMEYIKNNVMNEIKRSLLPDDVSISTMTITCNFPVLFNLTNIAKYVDLSQDAIQSVTHGIVDDTSTNRTIIVNTKKKSNYKKKKKKNFQNQVSMYVNVKSKNKKPVNVKLFKNGSIQMTGCKTIDHAIEVLGKISNNFKVIKAIIKYNKKQVVEKPFVDNIEFLGLEHITKLKVDMINSNFNMDFKIDRGKLYQLLTAEGYNCLHDPIKHACVNVKYDHPDRQIAIFVFEKGSIIITGAKNCEQIADAYMFINKYLLTNYKHIIKNDILTDSNIFKYMEKAKGSF